MSRAWAITRVELRRFLRDRSNIFFVFVLPLGLVVFIGLQFGDVSGPQVGMVAAEGPRSVALADRLDDAAGLTIVEVADEDELVSLVSRGNLSAGVVVPGGFDVALDRGEPVEVGFVGRPDATATSLRTVVEAAIAEVSAASSAARSVAGVVEADVASLVPIAEDAISRLSPIIVETEAVGGDQVMAEFASMGQFDLGASSQLFLFVFLTSLAGSGALIQTRRYGVAARMLSTSTRLPIILAGLGGGRLAIAGFQAIYIIGVTALAFGVDWGDPLTTGVLVLLFCLVSAAAGMLLGALFRNDSQASSAGVGLGLILAALGGSMMALEFFPEGMRRVALFTPHGWANTAMAEIVRRDAGLIDIATELAVLAGMAVGLLALATWLLRRAITR